MIRSAVRPAISRAVRPAIPTTRSPWYCKLNGVNGYGQFDREITVDVNADFDVSFGLLILDVSAINTAAFILGLPNSSSNGLWISSNGTIAIRDSTGFTISSGSGVVSSGTLHKVSITKVNGITKCIIDGVEVISSESFKGFRFMLVGCRKLEFFILGVIANLAIKVGGTTVFDCYIDQKGEEIQTNRADPTNNLTLHNVDPVNDWVEL